MSITDAYEMGREAFYRGDESSLNPFDEADGQRDEWDDGYYDSFNKEMEDNPPIRQVMEH